MANKEKTDNNKFYVTTPIYYVTAKPHLGSLYSTVLADVAARWNKVLGKKVFFLTGTDEHGQKIEQAAQKVGKAPKDFVDSFIADYKNTWDKYEIAYDYFIRTTDQAHVKAVQEWLMRLQKQGDIYKATYQGWYCTPDETFVLEKEAGENLAGTGGPLCPSCGRPTVAVSEETYFFKLSAYQDRLLAFYEQHPDFIVPKERAHEVINFVQSGLKDLSISRTTVKWGIPFPGDNAHVTYVWADALNNYITAVGYAQQGKEEMFAQWWPADLQILGKDILRFHAVYWPAFLMASGLEIPHKLLVHGWIKVNQQKMSKSLGNVVDPHELLAAYGADAVRYYLVRQIAVTHDSDFSIEDLEQKISSDLADALGNLLNRMVSLAHKYDLYDVKFSSIWTSESLALRDECQTMITEFSTAMDECMYHMAYARLWRFINSVNAYFHGQEPWKVVSTNKELFEQIISATAHSLRAIAVLVWPVMPKAAEHILDSLGKTFVVHHDALESLALDIWRQEFLLKKVPMLFNKPEEKIVENPVTPAEPKVIEPTITIDEFIKVQLAVGTIEQCESVPNSDKLYKLQVNFGDKGIRQILSGIKKSFAPEELIGKQAVFVFNLLPRKMMGLESHGMLLTALADDGKLRLVTCAGAVPNGTLLR